LSLKKLTTGIFVKQMRVSSGVSAPSFKSFSHPGNSDSLQCYWKNKIFSPNYYDSIKNSKWFIEKY
jgi:hypothetical protein